MVQLMQYDFAKRLKLKLRELRVRQFFSISSPGGGKDNVTQFVTLPLKLKAKPEGEGEAGMVYDSLDGGSGRGRDRPHEVCPVQQLAGSCVMGR